MVAAGSRRTSVVGAVVLGAALVTGPTSATAAGPAKPAIFHNGVWHLRTSLTSGPDTATFAYGRNGDVPVMGDWNADGGDTVGIARFPAGATGSFTWFLRNSNTAGAATVTPFQFGAVRFVAVDRLGSIPIVGDWDGDGDDTVGVAQFGDNLTGGITFQLRNSNTAGPPDIVVTYGRTDLDYPIVGDWDGDGTDTVGVSRAPNRWLLRNSNSGGPADISFAFGASTPGIIEYAVPGDWDGDGSDNPGVVRNVPPSNAEGGARNWLLRSSNSSGPATSNFLFGSEAFGIGLPSDFVPRLSWR